MPGQVRIVRHISECDVEVIESIPEMDYDSALVVMQRLSIPLDDLDLIDTETGCYVSWVISDDSCTYCSLAATQDFRSRNGVTAPVCHSHFIRETQREANL